MNNRLFNSKWNSSVLYTEKKTIIIVYSTRVLGDIDDRIDSLPK